MLLVYFFHIKHSVEYDQTSYDARVNFVSFFFVKATLLHCYNP